MADSGVPKQDKECTPRSSFLITDDVRMGHALKDRGEPAAGHTTYWASHKLAIPWQRRNLQSQIVIESGHAQSVSEIGRRSLSFQILTPSVKMLQYSGLAEAQPR
jgi:hypothetical protein